MSNQKLTDYIKKSNIRSMRERREHILFGDVNIFVKDSLPEGFNLRTVIDFIEAHVPRNYTHDLDTIFVGQFEELLGRDLQALYKEGAIYLTNEQMSEQKMGEDIIHELAHCLEEVYGMQIYSDHKIHEEFLGKRKRLFEILKAEGYNASIDDFYEVEYDKDFDYFLYREVGYPTLTMMTIGLFLNPYSATSLREYFASGFEESYIGDRAYVKKISPQLFLKIEDLEKITN